MILLPIMSKEKTITSSFMVSESTIYIFNVEQPRERKKKQLFIAHVIKKNENINPIILIYKSLAR